MTVHTRARVNCRSIICCATAGVCALPHPGLQTLCGLVALQVPLTVVHREGLPLDGTAPALLVAYGAYGECLDPDFEVDWVQASPMCLQWAVRHHLQCTMGRDAHDGTAQRAGVS